MTFRRLRDQLSIILQGTLLLRAYNIFGGAKFLRYSKGEVPISLLNMEEN